KEIFCIFAALVLCGLVSGGPAGTEFALSFMQNSQLGTNSASTRLMLDISNPSKLSANVKVTALGKIFEQTIQPGQGATFQLPSGVEISGTTTTYQTVQVLSDQKILVSSFNYKLYSSDTSLIYPVEDWGTEYYLFTPMLGPLGSFKEFSVVNYDTQNSIEVQLSGVVLFEGSFYPRGSKLTFNLMPMESAQIQSQDDLTGSRIKSQQPVAVFAGHSCAWFYSTCSHVYEQLIPVSNWGKEFMVAPINCTSPQFRFDTVQIIASQTTTVNINSHSPKLPIKMIAGESLYLNLYWPDSFHITADNVIQVLYLFNGGTRQNGDTIEPFLMTILPIDFFGTSYILYGQTDFTNQAVAIAQTKDLDGLTFDMLRLPQNPQWQQVGASEYSWAQMTYAQGSGFHTVSGPNPFGLYSIGMGNKNGYGSAAPGTSAVSSATCTIFGDPHYNTFDKKTYDFQGTCTYTAAQACHLGTKLTPFAVVVQNALWDEIQSSPDVSMAKVVVVEVYNLTLVLRRNQLKQIMVDNILNNIPLSLLNGQVKVFQEGLHYAITTDFGLKVTYDMIYRVTITVPSDYGDKMCGLCGNYNGNPNDEYQLPEGKQTTDVNTFGAAWKVPVAGVVCDDGCIGNLCPICDPQKKIIYEKDCSIITDPKGPFAACHGVINPMSYFNECVYDVCIGEGDRDMFCQSVGSYVIDCQDFGVAIQNWRTPQFCPLTCPANSHYQICAVICDTPCPGLTDIITCNENTCKEGCACNSGFYFNGTGCIPVDKCGCYENGVSYEIGESEVQEGCYKLITCKPSGEVTREFIKCNGYEICQIQNGVRGCYPAQCLIEAGGSITLFSGISGGLAETGAYEIVKVCNDALDAQWFRAVVEVLMCGETGFKGVAAVYVFYEGGIISVNRELSTWVNGMKVALPKQLNNNISVQLSGDAVVIKMSALTVTYSTLAFMVTVNGQMDGVLCGACSQLNAEYLTSSGMNIWRAPDFPMSCV
ncbi:hypothetical protein IRJ41_016048, partial [Triplophysa rosa]